MTNSLRRQGLVDTDTALRHEIESLAQRFPDVDRADIDRRVQTSFEELRKTARVQAHLIALTSAHVTDDLIRAGHPIHHPSAD